MLLFRKRIDMRLVVFIVDASFPAETLNVRDLIHRDCVFLVECGTV